MVPTSRAADGSALTRWRWVAWTAVGLATCALLLAGLRAYAANQRQKAIQGWENRLTSMADDRQAAVEAWLDERWADGRVVASFPTVRALLTGAQGPEGDARSHLGEILAAFASDYGYVGILVLDSSGAPVISSPDPPPVAPEVRVAIRTAARDLRQAVIIYRGVRSGMPRMGVLVRAGAPPPNAGGGWVLLVVDPAHWLFPVLQREPVPTESGETVLAERVGDQIVFINPLRHHRAEPLTFTLPFDTPNLAARAAILGEVAFKSYADYRGVPAFAATRSIRGTPWGLVVKVDREEALAPHRRSMLLQGLALFALVGALASAGFGLWRNQAARGLAAVAEERRRSEGRILQLNRLLRTISEVNQLIVREGDAHRLREEACRILVEHGGFKMAWVGFKEPDGTIQKAARAGDTAGYLDAITVRWDDTPEGRGPTGTAVREGRPVLNPDVTLNPAMRPWRAAALSAGYLSSAGLPLKVRGETVGALTVYHEESDAIGDEEMSLLDELAGDLGFALETIRNREEKAGAEAALAESRRRVEVLVENLGEGVGIVDPDERFVYSNPAQDAIFGVERHALVGRNLSEFAAPDEFARYRSETARRSEGKESRYETTIRRPDGSLRRLLVTATPHQDAAGGFLGTHAICMDITERMRAEKERESTVEFLALANRSQDTRDLIRAATAFFQEKSGCEAVGVRLREGEDFPYFETRGFPTRFVRAENSLCAKDSAGQIARDAQGSPYLECMCGNVLCGRTDPSKPFFTAHGSFWSNGTTRLLATTTDADRQTHTRNRCNGEGYESVALVPLRSGNETYGLLQLNDHRPDRFTREAVELWERLAGHLAVALAKCRVEEALRASEERYRFLFTNMTEGYAHCRMRYEDGVPVDFIYLDVNDRFEGLTGLGGVTGRWVTEVIPGIREANAELFERYGRVAMSGEPESFETFVAPLNMWFSISVYSPAREHFVAVFDVITERKRTESELRASERRFRGILENMQDAYFRADLEGRFTIVSPSAARIYGYASAEEMVGLHADALYQRAGERDEVVEEIRRSGRVYDRVGQGRRKDGSLVWVSLSAQLCRDDQGQIVGTEGVVRDVTERIQGEEQVRLLNERLRLLATAIQELAAARAESGVVEVVRRSARGLVGSDGVTFVLRDQGQCHYVDEEAIGPLWKGQRFPMTSCISGWAMLNARAAVIEDIFDDPRIPVEAYRRTFVKSLAMVPIRREDPVGAIGAYWKERHLASGDEVQLLQTLADAASRALENVRLYEELEERVERRTAELIAANQELEAFSYSVSHDLRAPLRAINGFSQALVEDYGGVLDQEGMRLLEVIRSNTHRMGCLIDDLLSLSRAGRREAQMRSVDMRKLVLGLLEEWGTYPPPGTLELHVGELPCATGDAALLKQVWANLLANALKFSAGRNPRVIKVTGETRDDETLYEVSDNGVGFDAAYAHKLFGVFQRLHGPQEFEGTGVGLAIVKRIVTRHGGRVWAEGRKGEGATFGFSLPADREVINGGD